MASSDVAAAIGPVDYQPRDVVRRERRAQAEREVTSGALCQGQPNEYAEAAGASAWYRPLPLLGGSTIGGGHRTTGGHPGYPGGLPHVWQLPGRGAGRLGIVYRDPRTPSPPGDPVPCPGLSAHGVWAPGPW